MSRPYQGLKVGRVRLDAVRPDDPVTPVLVGSLLLGPAGTEKLLLLQSNHLRHDVFTSLLTKEVIDDAGAKLVQMFNENWNSLLQQALILMIFYLYVYRNHFASLSAFF